MASSPTSRTPLASTACQNTEISILPTDPERTKAPRDKSRKARKTENVIAGNSFDAALKKRSTFLAAGPDRKTPAIANKVEDLPTSVRDLETQTHGSVSPCVDARKQEPLPGTVARLTPKPETIALSVRGLKPTTTKLDVMRALGRYGKVVSCSLLSNECAIVEIEALEAGLEATKKLLPICGEDHFFGRAGRDGRRSGNPGSHKRKADRSRELHKVGGSKRKFEDRG